MLLVLFPVLLLVFSYIGEAGSRGDDDENMEAESEIRDGVCPRE